MAGVIQTFKQLRSEGIEGYFAIKYAQFAKDTPAMREAYAAKADYIFHTLMGGEVPPRKAFIQVHAKSVRNLDI